MLKIPMTVAALPVIDYAVGFMASQQHFKPRNHPKIHSEHFLGVPLPEKKKDTPNFLE